MSTGSAYNYEDGETSSDSDDEVLRRYQTIQHSASQYSIRGSQRKSSDVTGGKHKAKQAGKITTITMRFHKYVIF